MNVKFLFLIFCFILSSLNGFGQSLFKPLDIAVSAENFYIQGLVDEASKNDISALVFEPAAAGERNRILRISSYEFLFFLKKQLISRPSSDKISIVLAFKNCSVREVQDNNNVQGLIKLKIDFRRLMGHDTVSLVSYEGGAHYTRSILDTGRISPLFTHVLGASIDFFKKWMHDEAGTNLNLARSLELVCTDYQERDKRSLEDTVYYSPKRPLIWDDFREIPPLQNKFAAEIFPILGYNLHTSVKNGTVMVTVGLKAAIAKSGCWVKPGAQDAYNLNHEQRHFDLLEIAAAHFKANLRTQHLSILNYEGELSALYLDAYRDMSTIEEQYDKETRHGILIPEQERWNKKIDQELEGLKIFFTKTHDD